MSEFDSFSSRFERSLSDLNDMRMALGVMEYGPVDNPRFGQFERLRLDTRKMIACEFGEKTTGINVLEAAYFQMRCSGMSEEKAVSNADKLMPLVLLGNTEKVPVLTVGVNALSKVANVIIYGKQFSGSPYISVVNPTQGETAYLQPIFPSDDINYRTTTRAYMPNTDWQVGYWDRGPNLEKLSVLDDAEEFDHLMKDGSSKILMLIGAQAVEMALPSLAGRHGSADGLGTVINFVKKSQDPDVKINEKSLNETAEDLLAKAITSNGKERAKGDMPINLSGSAVEQFKPEVLHSEILYKLMDDDNQKAEVIAEMLGVFHEQSGSLLTMEECCKFVQDAVAGIFVSANYNKAKEFVYGYDSRHYAGTVISLLRRYLSTRPIMHVLSNLRLARSIRELEAQSLEKNDESG